MELRQDAWASLENSEAMTLEELIEAYPEEPAVISLLEYLT